MIETLYSGFMQGLTMKNEALERADKDTRTRFEALLKENQGILFKVAYSYCSQPNDRDDLIQEICWQLWRSFPKYDESRKFSTWMYRVALNVAISHLRHNNRSALRPLSIDSDEASGIAAPEPIQPDERITELNRQIQQLEPLNRALLLLYLEERSYREIAEVLGISETNVATKISRLKQRIRQEMGSTKER